MSLVSRIVSKVRRTLHPPRQANLEGIPESVLSVMRRVREDRLTYLPETHLASLVQLCMEYERRGDEGVIIEAGCALGGSAIALCATKSKQRPLRVYDVFGMIPPPGEKDDPDVHERYQEIKSGASKGIDDDPYYGYEENLYDKVKDSFARFELPVDQNAAELIKGLVQDTLEGDDPVCLAHVDVDWFDPVMTCLERIVPRLIPGGAIVLDDYNAWSGCRKATDEYFAGERRAGFEFDDSYGHMVIRRKA